MPTDKKKVESFTAEELKAISERNLSGKGWYSHDLAVTTNKTATTTPTPVNKLGLAGPGNDSRFTSPEEQAKIQQVLTDPTESAVAKGPVEAAKGFLGKLFDTSDTWTPNGFQYEGNPVETVWDSFWGGLGWTNDRINQASTAGLSALPGGTRTLTWDEAGNVSVGQEMIANVGASVGRARRGEGTLGDIIMGIGSAPLTAIGMLAPEDTATQQAGFDITNPEDQKVFESGWEKFGTGSLDAAFSLFADPTILVGKAGSIAKLRYLDDTFKGDQGLARLRQQFVDSADKAIPDKAPIASFAAMTTQVAEDGSKILSRREIARRISGATNQEVISSALYHNTDEKTAELILRYSFNDAEAGKELLARRPAIATAMMMKQREQMAEILARDPAKKETLLQSAANAEKKLNDKLKKTPKDSDEYARLLDAIDRAQETYAAVKNNTLFDLNNVSGVSPEVKSLLAREHKDIIAHNKSLAKFLGDEQQRVSTASFSWNASTKGFSANNAFGRAVEASRMSRVKAGAKAEAARGGMVATGRMIERINKETGATEQVAQMKSVRPWQSDVFGQNGFTRAVQVWRWFGEENPQGLIITKGEGAMGSWKAVKAALDDVDIFNGEGRTIILEDGTTTVVGGAKKKEELLGMYMDAVHDSTAGFEATQVALARVEDAMFNEISAWHGISKSAAESLKRKAMSRRDQLVSDLRDPNVGFWIDESGKQNRAPWLESQIQNGTYMLNYRAFNRLAKMYDESGLLKTLDTGREWIGENARAGYNLFNEMWRPATLLRLGYTQRNVAEGLFRATAYTFSIDPIRYALVQGKNALGNTAVKWAIRGSKDKAEAAARLRAAGNSRIPMPERYIKWLGTQIDATDRKIAESEQAITQPGFEIADSSKEVRDFMVAYYKNAEQRYADKAAKAKALNGSTGEVDQLLAASAEAASEATRLAGIKVFTGETEDSINAFQKMRMSQRNLEFTLNQRANLDNDISATAMYRKMAGAKSRVMNGVITVGPHKDLLPEAFNPESSYTDIALSNLSADATTRSMSIATSDSLASAFRHSRLKEYVDVKYGDKNYFNGVASALRQIKFSEIGSMAINGKNATEIADFLYKTKEGREILDFIISGENRAIRKGYNTGEMWEHTYSTAQQIAEQTISRYYKIAPDAGLRDYMRTVNVDANFNGKSIEGFLNRKGPDGKAMYKLEPVVGHLSEELGAKSFRDTFNTITSTGMKWLGTIPEDAFVRAPFYGKRYEIALREMVDSLQSQIGVKGQITMEEYDTIVKAAHRRALKDTKDWMFTIERRTNLGTYGEVFVPFISATQNSVTTVGKLIWKDPAVAAIMVKLWQAPEKMGITDDEGNLIFPIPHDLIPDGFEKALGLENQRDFKIGMNQLNLIASQISVDPSQGALQIPPLFQFGPTVAVPASLAMKYGFFGTPDVPTPLKAILGEETASLIWETWKDYTFGTEGAANPNWFESLLPATVKRVVQYWQGTDNEQYAKIYAANLYTEWVKYKGNMRENPPTKEEITTMTNNLTLLKFLGNAGFAFPPQYDSTLRVVVDEYKRMQDAYGKNDPDGTLVDRMFAQQYGDTLLIAKDLGMSKGYAPPKLGMVETANKYQNLIGSISASLGATGDLSVLSMLFSDNPDALFDGSIYAWQKENNIPGVSTLWRERLTPEEALVSDAKNAGWVRYLQLNEQIKARLAEKGLTSLRQSPQLSAEKDSFIAQMANDPLYEAWYKDWNDHGSTRTLSTIQLMQRALSDPQFISDHKDSDVWSAAGQYLEARAYVVNELNNNPSQDINANSNIYLQRWWDDFRSNLENTNPNWAAFSGRFLDGDNNPINPGVSFGMQMIGVQ
jgi:hypothetical protein